MWVIICCGTNGRCVIFGHADEEPTVGQPIKLTDARMVIYWPSECGGLFGLAARGPVEDTRLTSKVKITATEAVRQWLTVSDEAASKLQTWPDYMG